MNSMILVVALSAGQAPPGGYSAIPNQYPYGQPAMQQWTPPSQARYQQVAQTPAQGQPPVEGQPSPPTANGNGNGKMETEMAARKKRRMKCPSRGQ